MAESVATVRDLAAVVRATRNRLKLTQADVANRAGVSRQWLMLFEAGQTSAQLANVMRVLHALGLSLTVEASVPPAATEADERRLPEKHTETEPSAESATDSLNGGDSSVDTWASLRELVAARFSDREPDSEAVGDSDG